MGGRSLISDADYSTVPPSSPLGHRSTGLADIRWPQQTTFEVDSDSDAYIENADFTSDGDADASEDDEDERMPPGFRLDAVPYASLHKQLLGSKLRY